MKLSPFLFSMVGMLGSMALGCGGSGSGGSGGSGASGGSGGTGGAAGSGGSTIPESTCTAEDDLSSPATVGFNGSPAPEGMVISLVEPTRLELDSNNGSPVDFAWAGPDLTQFFAVGDAVQGEVSPEDWHLVTGLTRFAATYHVTSFGAAEAPPPLPFPGPTLTLDGQCFDGSTSHAALVATLDDEVITIEAHQTGTVGGFQVHNGGIRTGSGGDEILYEESVTVFGPAPLASCTADDDLSAPANVGFFASDPLPEQMTITSVEPAKLALGAGSVTGELRWEGPDLTQYFSMGESVEAKVLDGWAFIASTSFFAVTYRNNGFALYSNIPTVPHGGPTLKPVPHCKVSAGPSSSSRYWTVVATLGEEEITLKGHETATIGAFQVTNAGHYDTSSNGESYYGEAVTALGPVPAP